MARSLPNPPPSLLALITRPAPTRSPVSQADVVSQIDVQLRQEMVEAQKEVARWTTEQKQVADAEARSGQRMLDEDKGARTCPAIPRPRFPPSHPTPACVAENLLRAHEELAAIHEADEALSQRAKEDSQRMEELRRELQRLTAIQATLPPEEQQLSRQLEQQRLLLQERERGARRGRGGLVPPPRRLAPRRSRTCGAWHV